MGLDMYAYTTREDLTDAVDFKVNDASEIHYWRKHPDLHGWMARLYFKKGGSAEEFNCVPVALTREDLDQLECDVKGRRLPHTTGFFFGESEASDLDDDLVFIAKAREAIAAGMNVFYDSWW